MRVVVVVVIVVTIKVFSKNIVHESLLYRANCEHIDGGYNIDWLIFKKYSSVLDVPVMWSVKTSWSARRVR